MKALMEPLSELGEFEELKKAVERGETPVAATGCIDTQKSQFIHGLGSGHTFRLIITYNELRAKEMYDDYRLYDREVYYYPARDLIFYSADIHGQAIVKERLKIIKRIVENQPTTIITTLDGGMDFCLPFVLYENKKISLKEADIIDLEKIKKDLVTLGYENVSQVDDEGQFAVRGGILDIFPLTEEQPYRIELWGDEIDTIRTIDVESQRSIENVSEVTIYPAVEIFFDEDEKLGGIRAVREEMENCVRKFKEEGKVEEGARLRDTVENFIETYEACPNMVNLESYVPYFCKETVSFFDYFKDKDIIVFLDELNRANERCETVEYEFRESMANRLTKGYILPGQTDVLYNQPQLIRKLLQYPVVLISTLDGTTKDIKVSRTFSFFVQSSPSYNNNFAVMAKDIESLKKKGYRVLLLSASETRGRRLCTDLEDFGIYAVYDRDMSHSIEKGQVMVAKGNLRRGFEYPLLSFVVVTEGDIFGGQKKKKKKKQRIYEGTKIHSFSDLKVGDYVVHENHGLGIYQGIEKIEVDKVTKDYLKIQYAGGSNLYVLATSLDVLQKYAGSEAKAPKLNRLNSPEWKKTKTRVKGAVKEIAKELVDLYAKRQAREGFAYGKDTVWQTEFEEMFPYEETDDQLSAIEATKRDMESKKIMDRLVCGDVGYGKTEIAIRAAFKAVQDGKQVAFLVPTTILARQHYETFVQRMKDFPISVDMVSRLRSKAQQTKTLERLRKGSLDIIIGTHRLLSKDIQYKDLGLLIVDEEQRFGVTHKEKLKQLKNDIDVLTLSATPIPRTLHMSLVGIRDMSVLEEPPVDRMPIQTFVMEKSDEVIREAIIRELARGGQVYYVYNRVNNMDVIANEVAKLVPEAVVSFANGQMNERELEKTMVRFIEGEIDVLIATTIVETGLDIPNVNTIIIDDADKLGLSQLYQLRGRVGRSNRTAYAFLMYKRDKMLKEVAEKRLEAIKEFTDLGSGFKISMRDLEIRGAGNLLGAKQHGHMEAVGYDLYCKMLNEAVKSLKGEKIETMEYETTVDVSMDAFIPATYIRSEFQKLDMYKRVAEIENEEERADIEDELVDRFGEPPKSVKNLLDIALIKAKAHDAYMTAVVQKGETLRFVMYNKADIAVEKIPEVLQKVGRGMRFVPESEPYFAYTVDKGKPVLKQAEDIIREIRSLKHEEK